ncbi:MAG: 2-phospho-L-lactate guanylyltransferase [Alphaproteobacteria bacterium]|nr:2-phospho-L-lactate guanylyltransferase [Alphaproteobacteria bacterium]
MKWTAILPLKPAAERKNRLASVLSPAERKRLTETLLEHATLALRGCDRIGSIHLLSASAPADWSEDWIADAGRGLNDELSAARFLLGAVPLVVIHPDLPLLSSGDVEALIDAAESSGVAIAPDRHRTGTNAVAVAAGIDFGFRFGPGSFIAHRNQGVRPDAVIETPGLMIDLDTPEDLDCAVAGGFVMSPASAQSLPGEGREPV